LLYLVIHQSVCCFASLFNKPARHENKGFA
jgi:hypothetical protein